MKPMILTTIWLLIALCGNVCMHIDCLTDCLMRKTQLSLPLNRGFSITSQDRNLQQQRQLQLPDLHHNQLLL
jgi:hypothetical protein